MIEPGVAIVILNFNGKAFLEKFIPTLIQHSAGYDIYVGDNCSSDDSISYLKKNFPAIKVIENKINHGYADGYNIALRSVEAEYYILLNNDVEVTANWIKPVIDLMQSNKKIAACQPKLLDYNNRNLFEYAGASGGFIDKYCYPFCRGRIFNALEEDNNQYDQPAEVFWATGACMFVRATAFWEVEGFDGDYFAHMEEIDLCWRLKNIGYSIYAQPESKVYHVGGGTLNKVSTKKTFLNFRNNLTTLTKNHPPRFLFFKIFHRMNLDGVAAFKFLFEGQAAHFFAVLRAHYSYYGWLPKMLAKRRKARLHPNFKYTLSQVYFKNIAYEHFINKKNKFSELEKNAFLD